MRFIFSLAHFNATNGRRFHRFGLSSGWLATLKEGQQILVNYDNFRFQTIFQFLDYDLVRANAK